MPWKNRGIAWLQNHMRFAEYWFADGEFAWIVIFLYVFVAILRTFQKYSYYELEAEVPVDRNMISWQQVSSGAARFFDNNRHLTVDSEMTQLPSLCSVDVKCASDLCSD